MADTKETGNSYKKYLPTKPVQLKRRQWPDKVLSTAPRWCSVDLRDGNQALPTPMNIEEKTRLFKLLIEIGFDEIEAGFPAASEVEYDFIRKLINENIVPKDVYLQVMTQCREPLIRRTFESIKGANKVVLHFYNSTSALQRKVVFKASQAEVRAIAVEAAMLIRELAEEARNEGVEIVYEYSPESFNATEPEYALEICENVLDTLEATREKPVIINLPNTVEMASPNIFADQIENFIISIKQPERMILSVHPHNDRGTAVAATELAMLAGAQRVEGTLFGNGERTGNVDLITLALNIYTQGIDPKLNISDINNIRKIYESCTRMKVHERQPYSGELVYTSFSGSHQDAISKGLAAIKEENSDVWSVPYLLIDPADVGRQYEPIIRINSQSGKSGAAFVMENDFGYRLPKNMHPEFGRYVQKLTEESGREINAQDVLNIFYNEFVYIDWPYRLVSYQIEDIARNISETTQTAKIIERINNGREEESEVRFSGVIEFEGIPTEIQGVGNGPLDALYNALKEKNVPAYEFISYDQHALTTGSDSRAIAYIQLKDDNGRLCFGVGTSRNINEASLRALLCAINRIAKEE